MIMLWLFGLNVDYQTMMIMIMTFEWIALRQRVHTKAYAPVMKL